MEPCSLVDSYQHFRGTCWFSLHHTVNTRHLNHWYLSANALNSSLGTVTQLRAGRSWVWIPERRKDFSSPNVRTGSATHQIPFPMNTYIPSRGKNGRNLVLTYRLHLVSRLRISGSILHLYVLMACYSGNLSGNNRRLFSASYEMKKFTLYVQTIEFLVLKLGWKKFNIWRVLIVYCVHNY